jgi:hypothetical protein
VLLPANEAVTVTVVFVVTVGAVYVTEAPVVEERLPTPDGLSDHVIAIPLNVFPEVSSTLAVNA